MVQTIISLNEEEDRVLKIVKAKFGLKNKSQAVALITRVYEESHLEPELRPEYLGKLKRIRKEGYVGPFNSIEELRERIESQ